MLPAQRMYSVCTEMNVSPPATLALVLVRSKRPIAVVRSRALQIETETGATASCVLCSARCLIEAFSTYVRVGHLELVQFYTSCRLGSFTSSVQRCSFTTHNKDIATMTHCRSSTLFISQRARTFSFPFGNFDALSRYRRNRSGRHISGQDSRVSDWVTSEVMEGGGP